MELKIKKNDIYTIGIERLRFKSFLNIIKKYHINEVIDIRFNPNNTEFEDFQKENLRKLLNANNIKYEYSKGFAAHVKSSSISINKGWTNCLFRGYADYMQSPKFIDTINKLIFESKTYTIAIMCNEKMPWNCHRSLIADTLSVRNRPVYNILDKYTPKKHILTKFAKVSGLRIIYPKYKENKIKRKINSDYERMKPKTKIKYNKDLKFTYKRGISDKE